MIRCSGSARCAGPALVITAFVTFTVHLQGSRIRQRILAQRGNGIRYTASRTISSLRFALQFPLDQPLPLALIPIRGLR